MSEFGQFFCLHRKFLIYNLVFRNLKVRYRKSIFGFLWTLLVPAAMTLVYVFVFKYIARMGGETYAVFILSGVIPWTFFATALATGTESLVNNFSILSKVPITISAFPLSDTVASFVNLILSLPVMLLAGLVFGIYPSWSWLSLPLIFGLLFLQAYSLALILAMANVFLRDVRHLVGIAIQIWMYLTPILYAATLIPADKYHWFYLNPLFGIFDSIHGAFLEGQWPASSNVIHMSAWTGVLVLTAFVINERFKYTLVEKL
jgi:ABC-type polysaccharide/polyol phosphate export permease